MEIKLDFENRKEAEKQVKLIQKAFDELISVCEDQKKQLQENVETIENAATQTKNLMRTMVDLSDTLKAIHLVLGRKKDLFVGDEEMKVIMDTLSTFILSSSSVKMGVMSEALNEHDKKQN